MMMIFFFKDLTCISRINLFIVGISFMVLQAAAYEISKVFICKFTDR